MRAVFLIVSLILNKIQTKGDVNLWDRGPNQGHLCFFYILKLKVSEG